MKFDNTKANNMTEYLDYFESDKCEENSNILYLSCALRI